MLRILLLVVVLAVCRVPASAQNVFYKHTNSSGAVVSRDNLRASNAPTVTVDPKITTSFSNMVIRSHWSKNGGPLTGSAHDVTVSYNATTKAVTVSVPNPSNAPLVTADPDGTTWQLKYSHFSNGPANTPVTVTSSVWTYQTVADSGPSVLHTVTFSIAIGDPPCTPQAGPVTFNVAGRFAAEGKAEMSLWINDVKQAGASKVFQGGPIDQPATANHSYVAPAGLPGEFYYEWRLGNTVLASGGAECGVPVTEPFWDNYGDIVFGGPFVEDTPSDPDKPQVNEPPPGSTTEPPPAMENGGSITAPPPSTVPPAPTPDAPTPEAAAPPPANPYTPGGAGGGTLSGSMTKDDFYESTRSGVKDGLKDMMSRLEGGGGEQPGDIALDSSGNMIKLEIPPESPQGKLLQDGINGMLDEMTTKMRQQRQKMEEVLVEANAAGAHAKAPKLPQPSWGKGTTGFNVEFHGTKYPVDLTPYRTAIDWLRQILVLVVTYTFWRLEILAIIKATQI